MTLDETKKWVRFFVRKANYSPDAFKLQFWSVVQEFSDQPWKEAVNQVARYEPDDVIAKALWEVWDSL